MAPQIPPGSTIVDTFKKSFVDVPVDKANDNAISTEEFLEAAESMVSIFDVLGSVAFSTVKSDILGNVKKLRDRFLAAPLESTTIQDLARNEIKSGKNTASEGLLWLNRGLHFTSQAIRNNLKTSDEELVKSFTTAYDDTLSKHHNWLIAKGIRATMKACPYRKDFYAKLGDDEAKVQTELDAWVKALEDIVQILNDFLPTIDPKWK